MALPTNTPSTAGRVPNTGTGVRNIITVNAPNPKNTRWQINGFSGSGQNTVLQNGSFGSNNTNVVPSGGSGSYSFGLFGKPKANGIEKALGAIGTGLALISAASALVEAGKGVLQTLDQVWAAAKAAGETISSKAKAEVESAERSATSKIGDAAEKVSVSQTPLKSDWRVRIGVNNLQQILAEASAESGYLAPLTKEGKNSVVFPYTPQIQVVHKATYTETSPVHNNFNFQSYKSSSVDDILINGQFTVQTQSEGLYWLAATRFFKLLTRSFYGVSYPQGFPPIVAQLYGYGDHMFGTSKGGINVVVKSVSIELARNVQYKRIVDAKGDANYVPLDSNINVTVSPVYNRTKLRQFSLNQYANGAESGIL